MGPIWDGLAKGPPIQIIWTRPRFTLICRAYFHVRSYA